MPQTTVTIRGTSRLLLARVLFAGLASVRADHGAPPPRLGGVSLCTDSDSVRVEVVGGAEGAAILDELSERALQQLRAELSSAEVAHTGRGACAGERGYVALELYARFLDPEVYLGFPEASYTYVAAMQVGTHASTRSPEGALPDSVYVASASDIFQAGSAERLAAELLALTDEQAALLTHTWLEANVVPPERLLLFAGLALALLGLRGIALWVASWALARGVGQLERETRPRSRPGHP
jgi:hypothetical protein